MVESTQGGAGWDVVTNPPDDEPVYRRFTNVWRAHGPTWQLLIRHATPFERTRP